MDWTPVLDWLASHGVRILIILLITVALCFAVRRLVPPALKLAVRRRMMEQPEEEVEKRGGTLSRVLVGLGVVLFIVAAAFMILDEIGINITPYLAGLGIAGIAVGFGAQSLVKDILAGIFILLENQYCVGDVVRIADAIGIVEEVNLRRTVLRDLDGIVHSVPNGEIRVASNYTKEWSRVNLNISVAYGTDLDYAIAVINRVCAEMANEPYWRELILKTPEVLRVDNLGDSGIEIKILGDTRPLRQWEVMGELRKRLKKTFDEEGIEIPWPHTKVYFGGPLPQGFVTPTPTPSTPSREPASTEVMPPSEEEGE